MEQRLPVGYNASDFIEGDSVQRHRLVADALQGELCRQCCLFLIEASARARHAAHSLGGCQPHCFYAVIGSAYKLRRALPEVEVQLAAGWAAASEATSVTSSEASMQHIVGPWYHAESLAWDWPEQLPC